ncbi:MAG: DNA polymerase III subunit gamma/tau [Clostridia bacterium]|nr:DNA polymerase III subunit gamma/tau [Clostridia bacterium]
MSYTALYRKFRPKNFSEVVGQDHVVQTLKNQIKSGRIGHAYLLAGGRGTGKTSTAKILARAINCLNPQDGEPCNECEICKAMLDGSLTDVVEMDAASNNSVEDIRSIKEKVNFLPTLAKYRVYIIDEVHMLSTGAFNALLKTLEEPPEHVKFILATTEPQKLLATILSRCQRFDFKKISNENIIKRLKIVCEESQIQITDTALNLIATLSEGAARDALSILERCVQDGETNIDENKIKDLVGIPKFNYVHSIIKGITEKDIETSLKAIQDILDEGKDLENFLWEMIKHTKNILMYKVSKKNDIYNEEEIEQIGKLSEKVAKEELINIIYKLSELENKMKMTSQKTIIFETEVIKLCMKIEIPTQSIQPQKIYETPKVQTNTYTQPSPAQAQASAEKTEQKQMISQKEIKPVKLAPGQVIPGWQTVISNLKSQGKLMIYTNLIGTEAIEINDMTVAIRFNNGLNAFRKSVLEKPENMSVLTKEISVICGKPMQIKLEDAAGNGSASTAKTASIKTEIPKAQVQTTKEEPDSLEDLGIDINFIEEE